ncbi:MAG TPA: 50S ribosomal protein L17 [Candidatus Paceibacterota bacterium]|nr:50S ribosomal protein L17 [Candidatus Paceibacterota bacterium]
MRHRKVGKKFHRITGRRRSFLRNLANDLIRAGRIETTEVRAKVIRSQVERLVTLAKKQTLAARRLLIARLGNPRTASKLFEEIAPKYATRAGGYLRIKKLGTARKRDAAPTAIVEFV